MSRIYFVFILVFALFSPAFAATSIETEESLSDTAALKILHSAVSKSMGSAEAATLNAALTAFASAGEFGLKAVAASHANSLIDKYIVGSKEQEGLKQVINKWQNGKLSQSDISSGVKCLGTSALKNAISQSVGKTEAALLNKAIDKYIDSGMSGIADVGQEELNRLIHKYIKGEPAQKALTEAVDKIRKNDLANIDVGKVGREITRGALENWVDKQGWSTSEKEAAKKIISGTLDNGVDGLTEAVVESIQKKISKEIGGEAGKAVGKLLDDILDGKNITGERVKEDLGTVAQSAALKILHSAVSKNMGSAEAAILNAALTAFASAGEFGLKAVAASHVNSLIDKYITGSREQEGLKQVINKWQNGKLSQSDISSGVKCLGTSALKNAISQNVGKTEAALLNKAIDKYIDSGMSGIADVGQEELNRLIHKYIKGEPAQKALTEAVDKIRKNDLANIDVGKVGREITRGALENWVDKQGWSASEKEAAKKIISGTLDNGIDGLTEAVVESIQKKISKEIGGEAGKAVGKLLDDILDGKNITGERVKEDLGTVAQSAVIDAISKQFEKLAKKYPVVSNLLDKLGIKDDILNAAANIKGIIANAKNLKDLVLGLANLTMETLNALIEKLASFGKSVIKAIFNQIGEIVESIVNAVVDLLVKFVSEMVNELLEYAKQIAQMVTELTKTVFYIINDVKDNIKTVIDAGKELVSPGKAALEIK